MAVTCLTCKKQFNLDQTQIELVQNLKSKKAELAMLKCSICGHSFPINTQDITDKNRGNEYVWRSPIAGCTGFVTYIDNSDEKPFWGCDETGVVWLNRDRFNKDIELIISRFPHRSDCYKKINGDWYPNEEEPEDIDEIIENKEEEEVITSFARN